MMKFLFVYLLLERIVEVSNAQVERLQDAYLDKDVQESIQLYYACGYKRDNSPYKSWKSYRKNQYRAS